jgi:hypothetical protein
MSRRKRTPIDGPGGRNISVRARELWSACCRMIHQGYAEDDEAFRDLALELHRELGLKPWHPFVVDVGSIAEDGDAPDDPSHLRDWLMVRDIRRRLVEGT